MKHRIQKLFILIVLLLGMGISLSQAAPVVKAALDSNVVMMGKMTVLRLTVEESKAIKGNLSLFEKLPEKGFIGVCGDSVELRMPSKIDTADVGANRKITYSVPVQSFDSGAYLLPKFVYIAGSDTSYSNQVALKVVPVNVQAEDQISDYAGTADPENPSIFDWVPDWMIDYWWLLLIILLCIAAFIYALIYYRRNGYIIPPKPQPTPYERAVMSLKSLREKKLWEQGLEKEYFTELTDILRLYIYGRFGINAMEMTSRQIINSLGKNSETKDKRVYLRQILNMADFVKFAKVRPLPDDNIAAYDNAWKFVEETKPVVVAEDEGVSTKNGKKNKKKGGKK